MKILFSSTAITDLSCSKLKSLNLRLYYTKLFRRTDSSKRLSPTDLIPWGELQPQLRCSLLLLPLNLNWSTKSPTPLNNKYNGLVLHQKTKRRRKSGGAFSKVKWWVCVSVLHTPQTPTIIRKILDFN